MRRILHILKSLDRGGTERFVMNLSGRAALRGVHTDFLLFTERRDGFCGEAAAMGARIFSVPSRRSPLRHYAALWSFFRRHGRDYDAVYMSGNSLTSVAPLRMARMVGVPVRIAHVHNTDCRGLHNRLLHRLNRMRVGRLATHFVACSPEAAEWGFGGTDVSGRVFVAANGIDAARFRHDPSRRMLARKALGLEGCRVVCCVARFSREKNHLFLLDVFAAMACADDAARLLLVGSGMLGPRLHDAVAELGLEGKVIFAGSVADVGEMLDAADCFVLPSLFEGMPFAAIEAQVSGLPAVVSDRVSADVDISGRVRFLPLEAGVSAWADALSRASVVGPESRESASRHVLERGGYTGCYDRLLDFFDEK